jgi:hypothetical protein
MDTVDLGNYRDLICHDDMYILFKTECGTAGCPVVDTMADYATGNSGLQEASSEGIGSAKVLRIICIVGFIGVIGYFFYATTTTTHEESYLDKKIK